MQNSQFKLLIVLHAATLFLVGMLFIQKPTNTSNNSSEAKSLGQKNTSGKCDEQSSKGTPVGSSEKLYEVDFSKSYLYGKNDAPNELVVFSNYTCGFCKKFYNEAFKELNEKYIKSGRLKVAFIFNGSPLNKVGSLMAKVAEISRMNNNYEAIQDLFYGKDFELDSIKIVSPLLKKGMKEKELIQKLSSNELANFIADQLAEGEKHEVRGTPIFFFNKKRLEGYLNKEDFLNFFKANYLK